MLTSPHVPDVVPVAVPAATEDQPVPAEVVYEQGHVLYHHVCLAWG